MFGLLYTADSDRVGYDLGPSLEGSECNAVTSHGTEG